MYPISVNIVSQDEEYWIEPSILSILDLVDEIIYVDDGSADNTYRIVKNLSLQNNKIKCFHFEKNNTKGNFSFLKRFALSQSRNEWILRWDGDFIAYENNNINDLFDLAIHSKKTSAYALSGPNLFGDVRHYMQGCEHYGPEIYLFRKESVNIFQDGRYADRYQLKSGEVLHHFKETVFLHMNLLKPLKKVLYRSRMTEYYLHNHDHKRLNSFWKWVEYTKSEKILSDEEEHEAIRRMIEWKANQPVEVVPFDFDKWGMHPKILDNYAENIEKFKLVRRGGQYFLDFPLE